MNGAKLRFKVNNKRRLKQAAMSDLSAMTL